VPTPEQSGPAWLNWRFDRLPVGGVAVTHWLDGTSPGRHPVSLRTRVDYVASVKTGHPEDGTFYLPVPAVDVQGTVTPATPLPTLPPPSTPTTTPSPTVTPSPTLTPTATPERGWVVYLPMVRRE